jgi:hypothetical protein
VHLAERGNPLVGESVYVRNFSGERIPAPRLMLHAAELGFVHPASEREMHFSRDPPADFAEVLARRLAAMNGVVLELSAKAGIPADDVPSLGQTQKMIALHRKMQIWSF